MSVSLVNCEPLLTQFLPEREEVLDDPVVDHGDVTGRVRVGMGVEVGRRAMGGPAGVADAGGPGGGSSSSIADQAAEFAFGLANRRRTEPSCTAMPAES